MSSVADDIATEVARINAIASCPVTGEPREAAGARDVAILIEPPTRDYVGKLQTWTAVIVRNSSDLGLATTKALSDVLTELEASDLAIEEARPGARSFLERPSMPAYFVTYTTA